MNDTVPEDFFRICHYDLKEPATFALACDEEYLYLCISARNGGLYKIGTGNGSTKAGKLYIYRQIIMAAEATKMVVIGDTIFRSYQSCEFATLKTYNKHTLESAGDVELNCPIIRSEQLNIRINKCLPLMTDGTNLYAIFKGVDLDPVEDSAKGLTASQPLNAKLSPGKYADEAAKAMESLAGGYKSMPFGLASSQALKDGTLPVPPSFPTSAEFDKLNPFGTKMFSGLPKEPRLPGSSASGFLPPPQPLPRASRAQPGIPSPANFFPSELLEDSLPPMPSPQPLPSRVEHQIKAEKVKPAQPKPEEVKPADSKPAEAKIEADKPKESQPQEVKPVEIKPEVSKPAEEKFVEIEPWLAELIEVYFSEQREVEIEERWKLVCQKKGIKSGEASKPAKKEEKIHFNKVSDEKAPVEAKKKHKSKTSKPIAKATTAPVEPEKDRTGMMNFYLYKYNLSSNLQDIKEEDFKDLPSVAELQESFNGLFTVVECARAYKLCHEDIVLAAQWLIEEGEKLQDKKCINYEQVTLLAQGEIDPKSLKAKAPKTSAEEIVLIHSIITDRHIQEECIYHEGSILIGRHFYFSADPKDEYEIPDEIVPQILQDKQFITPERSREVRGYAKHRGMLFKDPEAKFDLDMLEMDSQMQHYYTNIRSISQELSHLNSRGDDLSELELQNRFLLEAKVNTLQAKLALDKSNIEKKLEVKKEKTAPNPEVVEMEKATKNNRKIRGTFICKTASALERQEAFAPRCYESVSNVLYAVSTVKKNSWIQNPSAIVKSRDPLCYSKVFDFIQKDDEQLPRGKIFFDGIKEIEYGHAENDYTYVEEQRKYLDNFNSKTSELSSVKDLRSHLNQILLYVNTKRFSMPFKASNALEALNKIQKDIESQIKRATNPEEKKILHSKKSKIFVKIAKLEKLYNDIKLKEDTEDKDLISKLKIVLDIKEMEADLSPDSKINPTYFSESYTELPKQPQKATKPKKVSVDLIENKKQYCFCPIGSRSELSIIFNRLKAALESDNKDTTDFYLNMLLFWSYHMSLWIKSEKAHELIYFLLERVEQASIGQEAISKMESIIVRMIYFVGSDHELVQRILKLALKQKIQSNQPVEDIKNRINSLDYISLSMTNVSLLEKAYIILCRVKHYDVYHVFNQAEQIMLVNGSSRVRNQEPKYKLRKTFGLPIKDTQTISDLNESTAFYLLLQLQESIMENAINSDLLVKWRIYYGHYFNVWSLLESRGREEKVQKLVNEFVSMTFNFIERFIDVIDKDNLKNLEIFTSILEYLLCMVNIATCYLISTKSSTKFMANADFLATKNLKIMGTLMKIFKKVDAAAHGRISAQLKLHTEGLDTNQETIFETCHPLNRGESAKTNHMSFPDALGVIVQLDKRCQSDSGKDFLAIHSWNNSEGPSPNRVEVNINASSPNRLNIGIGFRVSGKMKNEDTFLLLGDSAKMTFDANPKSMDGDQSFKRWGYRMRSLPMYSYETTLQMTSLSDKDQGVVNTPAFMMQRSAGMLLIQLMSRLTVTLLREIDMFMKGRRVSIDEKRVSKYLSWTLMKSGLSSLKRELFLKDLKQGLKLTDKMKDSLGRSIGGGEDTVSRGRSIDETEKLSAQSKCELEKEFLQDTHLSDLLTKLQSNDTMLMQLISSTKGLQNLPPMLMMEKKRQTFTKELQKLWENTENLILLAMLHHSGLLNLLVISSASNRQISNLLSLDSVKEQLVEICRKKNEILNKMVAELQIERELKQTLDSMVDILQEKVKRIKEEREQKAAEESKASQIEDLNEDKYIEGDKDQKKVKLEELQKKYTKKRVGKKSDHVVPKREIDPKKKDKAISKKKTGDAKPETTEKKSEEAAIPEEKEEQIVTELFFDKLLDKSEIKELLTAKLSESRLSVTNYTEFILNSRSLPHILDDPQANQAELMAYLKPILLKSEADQSAIENPYVKIANKIDERCFFLLKIATSFVKPDAARAETAGDDKSMDIEGESDEELQPMDITRSLSSTGPGILRKNSNKLETGMEGLEKRVDILGEWINSYKKWKSSDQGEQNLESNNCSFLVSISSFLTHREPVDIKKLEKVLLRVAQRACCRALGLDMIKDCLNFAHDTWLSKYLVGVFSAPFK